MIANYFYSENGEIGIVMMVDLPVPLMGFIDMSSQIASQLISSMPLIYFYYILIYSILTLFFFIDFCIAKLNQSSSAQNGVIMADASYAFVYQYVFSLVGDTAIIVGFQIAAFDTSPSLNPSAVSLSSGLPQYPRAILLAYYSLGPRYFFL